MAWNEGHVFKDDEVGTTLKQKLAVQNAIAEAGVGKTKMVVGEQGTVASELIAGLMKNRFTAATGVVEEQVLQVRKRERRLIHAASARADLRKHPNTPIKTETHCDPGGNIGFPL